MSRLAARTSIVAVALILAAASIADAAPPPAGIGELQLRLGRDSLVVAASQMGYSLAADHGSSLSFASPESTAATIEAELNVGKVFQLSFRFPGVPTPDEFAAKEQEFTGRFGAPATASDEDSARVVSWQQDWAQLVLRAGFSVRAPRPYVARFSDLAAIQNNETPAGPSGKRAGKSHHKPKPKAGQSK